MQLTRRQFVTRSSAGLSLVSLSGGVFPALLGRAFADEITHPNRVLVVIELTGGNDGLNTVIPYEDAAYYGARPQLGIRDGLHRVDDRFAVHPAMGSVAELFKEGKAAIVHGVGYPRPNRSHFRSMEIWHTGYPESNAVQYGWLGRFLDNLDEDRAKLAGIAFAESLPQSLLSAHANVPAVRDFESYGVFVEGEADVQLKRRMIEELSGPARGSEDTNGNLGFLKLQAQNAYAGAKQLREAIKGFQPRGEYEGRLGRQLRMAAQVVAADLGARVIHVSLDGFDTHSNQPGIHAELLGQIDRGVSQFLKDLNEIGRADDVLVMTYSEFGRRVRENGSRGTDHGAAAPMFLFGNQLLAGFHGEHPSLTNLDDGDLKFTVDFRSIYTTLLEDWFGANAKGILGEEFMKLGLIKAAETRAS